MEKDEIITAEIITAAIKVFQQHGYIKVTMQDIAREVGKGRSTLYYYFKNKQEVFEAVVLFEFSTIYNKASAGMSKSKSLSQNLLEYNDIKLREVIKLLLVYSSLLDDIRENPKLIHDVKRLLDANETSLFKQLLFWGVLNKDIGEMPVHDMDYLAKSMVTALSSLELELLLYGSVEDMIGRLEWLITILVKGLK